MDSLASVPTQEEVEADRAGETGASCPLMVSSQYSYKWVKEEFRNKLGTIPLYGKMES